MKFGPVPLDEAEGCILAHGLRLADGRLKKGRVLDAHDVERLRGAGHRQVVAATLEVGDVAEDEAAERLARALAGSGVRVAAPFTGRCNLFAAARGLLVLYPERIDAVNRVHEALTVATLPGPLAVDARQMLATVKVIPFAVPRAALEAAEAVAREGEGAAAVAVQPFRRRRAALVQTRLEGTREQVLDKTAGVLATRLTSLDSTLAREWRCRHEAPEVAEAVTQALGDGHDLVLVVGASAIVDRRDVVPAGIEAAGGVVVHFGMPVDPGNLLLVARHGEVPVLGLPGCARSPKFNGLDQVLERLAAGLAVTPQTVTGMGVGGLLKEIPERPQPRGGADTAARAARVAAVVLAAGRSRRMGEVNKLLAEVDGVPMVRTAVARALAAGVQRVLVVTGHEASRVREAVAAAGGDEVVEFVHNPRYALGLSTSLACGIAALGEDVDAALVCLADMPRVRARDLECLLAAYDPAEGRSICVPTWRAKRGNPVLWDRRYFAEMASVRGDVGARHLIGEHEDAVCEVAMEHDGVLLDVDSPQALEALVPQNPA